MLDYRRTSFLVLTAALAMSVGACKHRPTSDANALPRLAPIPSFVMEDQSHRRVSDQTLRGDVLVVDFFFSSCTTSCPLLTARMRTIEGAIAKEDSRGQLPIKLVSITLDPENDTPDVLAAYGKRNGADPNRWLFLTGRSEELDRIVVKGFKLFFQKAPTNAGVAEIMHGEWIVLVDGEGTVRGYYASHDEERMTALVSDAVELARLAPAKRARPAEVAETSPADASQSGDLPRPKHHATGTLKSFGKEKTFVNIAHNDIPGYMSAMTMSFFPNRDDELSHFSLGDKVEFDFVETEDGRRLLTSISRVQ